MREFEEGSAPIMICTDAAGMGVNIRNMTRTVQWKISDRLVLAALLQRIGRAGRDKAFSAVAIVFVESKHLLPQDVTSDETSRFRDYTTAIGPEDSERAEEIILAFYKDNFQIRKEKVPTPYHAVDPAVPWFINTTGYPRRLALACFMSNTFYDYVKYVKAYRKNPVDEFYSEGKKGREEGLEESRGETHTACCDNCIYEAWDKEEAEIPVCQRHDITARHCRRYLNTKEYCQAASQARAATEH